MRSIDITNEISEALELGAKAVVAIGISGGKDSTAVALATVDHLRAIGFKGRTVLIHSDLGSVEWEDSLPKCRELAAHLGLELIIVRRKAGGMMHRWQGRWAANMKRFRELSCVKPILPWSTPSMRFCTSELKVDPITSELKKRFPGRCIINVMGIRRAESCGRKNAKVSKPNAKLKHKTVSKDTGMATHGYDWNAIATWQTLDVLDAIHGAELGMHEAYTKHGMSRVSCRFCILSGACDTENATKPSESHDNYREQCELEIVSTFSFQGDKWLSDVAPHLLSEDQRTRLVEAKEAAALRTEMDAQIPENLLYVKGWPVAIPTQHEAEFLAGYRRQMGEVLGIEGMECTTAPEVIARYKSLMAEKEAKAKKKAKKAA